MMNGFPELVIGGVLIAPFVTYAAVAFVIYLALRPVFRLIRFESLFSNPPMVMVSVYVMILALLVILV